MAELLRTISSRIRQFLSIDDAVKHHGPRIHQILDEKFNPLLPEGLKIDFLSNMQAIVELLRAMGDRLTATESVLVSERSGDTPTRLSRNEAFADLSSTILGARDSFEGVYDPVTADAYGFPRFIGNTNIALMRQGDYLAARLRNPDRPFPPPRFGGGLSIDAMAQSIEDKTAALRASLADAGKGTRIAEAAQVDKDRAQEIYDLFLVWGSRILQSYFILAGERKLAARIRPLIVRPGRGREGGQDGEGGLDGNGNDDVPDGEGSDAPGTGEDPGQSGPFDGEQAAGSESEPAAGSESEPAAGSESEQAPAG